MRQLKLPLKDNPYTIYIGSLLLDDRELINRYCSPEKILIVSNNIVAPLYLEKLKSSIDCNNIHQLVIEDGEINKSRESFFQIIDYLVANNFRRNDTLLALGGGVIGDLSGFAAASYQRGMNLVQIPTSLLAQVDSSVGGKTAINHKQGKNLIGAFYQPKSVIIDVTTLKSLPDREYFSGLGEVIKYALLGEKNIQRLLVENTDEILRRDESILKEIIFYSCQKKAEIVAKDEKEKGERALLNLGHTFAHALETLTEYRYYLHGEAVAIGILMALRFSQKCGLIECELVQQYESLTQNLNLPVKIKPVINLNQFFEAMGKDKKNQSDAYRLILVEDNRCIIREEQDKNLLAEVIKEFSQSTKEGSDL